MLTHAWGPGKAWGEAEGFTLTRGHVSACRAQECGLNCSSIMMIYWLKVIFKVKDCENQGSFVLELSNVDHASGDTATALILSVDAARPPTIVTSSCRPLWHHHTDHCDVIIYEWRAIQCLAGYWAVVTTNKPGIVKEIRAWYSHYFPTPPLFQKLNKYTD